MVLPELDWGQHLVDALLEFGPSMPGASGPVPVTFGEVESWARVTRTFLPGHEALLLRQLSRDYCGEYHAASDSGRPMPMPEGSDIKGKVQNSFANLVKAAKAEKGDDTNGRHNPRRPRRR